MMINFFDRINLFNGVFQLICISGYSQQGPTYLKKNFFFKLLFGCPTANFGPLSRGQPHSPDVNHCVLHIRPEGHREPRMDCQQKFWYVALKFYIVELAAAYMESTYDFS